MRIGGHSAQVGLETVRQGVSLAVVARVGDEAVAECVPARALGLWRGIPRPTAALATVQVVAGEPADASQERQRDFGPVPSPQHLVFRQAPVRQHDPLRAIAHVHEGPLRMGRCRMLGPTLDLVGQIQRPLDDVEVTVGPGGVHPQTGGEVNAQAVISSVVLDGRLEVHAAHARGERDAGDDGQQHRLVAAEGAVP